MKSQGWVHTLFALPVIIYLVLFRFLPFLGNIIAFLDFKLLKGFGGSEFIGLSNFERLFKSNIFWTAFSNTIRLNLLDLAIGFPFTIFLSLVLIQLSDRPRRNIQTILYIPYFISWAALGGIIVQMLSPSLGVVNAIGKLFSLNYGDLPLIMGNESSWVIVYVLTGIWQYAGWGTIIYVSYMLKINKSIYESAALDGADTFQKIIHITLPITKQMILIMLLLKISGILSASFEQIYALSNPMVLGVSDVLSTYEYRAGLQSMQFSYATALGLVESVIALIVVLVSRFLISKVDGEQIENDE